MKVKNEGIIAAVIAVSMLAACANKPLVKGGEQAGAPGAGAAGNAAETKNEPDVRASTMVSIPEMRTVRFDYDSAMLNSEAREYLKANASWLRQHGDVKVQVAGHCDERGTVEYNLALGQRRAAAVRHYYISLGVPARRIATISYGKERPLCQESNESCWAQNRRGETLRAAAASASRK